MAETAPPPSLPNNNTSTNANTSTTASATTGAASTAGGASSTGATAGTSSSNNNNTNAQSTNNAGQNNTGSADQSTTNRGLPYYEKLRRDLRDTLQKKRLMDKSMAQLEDQIFRFEQSYLEETTAGNIIKGFDNYIKGSSSGSVGAGSLALQGVGGGGGGGASRRKAQVTDADRVFSRSSASFMRDSTPSSVQTTPSHAPTPTSGYSGSAAKPNGDVSASGSVKGGNSSSSKNKKKSGSTKHEKNDDDDDTGDKPPAKRLKISYGRD